MGMLATEFGKIHNIEAMELSVQAVAGIILILALASHVTEVRTYELACSVLDPVVTVCTMPMEMPWSGVLYVGGVRRTVYHNYSDCI